MDLYDDIDDYFDDGENFEKYDEFTHTLCVAHLRDMMDYRIHKTDDEWAELEVQIMKNRFGMDLTKKEYLIFMMSICGELGIAW